MISYQAIVNQCAEWLTDIEVDTMSGVEFDCDKDEGEDVAHTICNRS